MQGSARKTWYRPVVANILVLLLGAAFHLFVANYEAPQYEVPPPAPSSPPPPKPERRELPPGTIRLVVKEDQTVAQLLAQNQIDPHTLGWIESTGPVTYPGGAGGRIHWADAAVPEILNYLSVRKDDEVALRRRKDQAYDPYEEKLYVRLPSLRCLAATMDLPEENVPPINHVISATTLRTDDIIQFRAEATVPNAKAWIHAAIQAVNGWEPAYDVAVNSVDRVEQLPTSGNKLVSCGVVHGTAIHIRIFDSGGKLVFDADEARLRSSGRGSVSSLKAILMKDDLDREGYDPYIVDPYRIRHEIAVLGGPRCLVWSVSPSPREGAVAEIHETVMMSLMNARARFDSSPRQTTGPSRSCSISTALNGFHV